MSDLTGAKRRNIPEDDILHTHRRENLKSYTNEYRFRRIVHRYKVCGVEFKILPCKGKSHVWQAAKTEG
jgi:hypothetical protein